MLISQEERRFIEIGQAIPRGHGHLEFVDRRPGEEVRKRLDWLKAQQVPYREYVRQYLLTNITTLEERHLIMLGQAMHHTRNYVQLAAPKLREDPVSDVGLRALDNFAVNVNGRSIGWVMRVQYDTDERCLIIGHVAVDHRLTRIGLGSKLLTALAGYAKDSLGATSVRFAEAYIDEKAGYREFFERLGAIPVDEKRAEWLLEIRA